METTQTRLQGILREILKSVKSQEVSLLQEVLVYESKLNYQLTTNRQLVRPQSVDKRVEAPSVQNAIEKNMQSYLCSIQAQVKEALVSSKPEVKDKQKPTQRASSTVKQVPTSKKQPPRQEATRVQAPKALKHKPQIVVLSRFQKSLQQLGLKQKVGGRVNIKKWVQEYRSEDMGYAQQERKARLGFLTTLGRYAPSKRNIQVKFTNKLDKRGWKGCQYCSRFIKFLESINKTQLLSVFEPRAKVVDLYRWNLIGQKLQADWQTLQQLKAHIKAPKLLKIQLKFFPPVKDFVVRTTPTQLSMDAVLEPFYLEVSEILEGFLQKSSLKKNDLKLLVEILNIVLSKGKKCYTVIKEQDIENFLRIMQDGPQRQ